MAANNTVRHISSLPASAVNIANNKQLDRLIGLAMLIIASTVFLYYTIWTLLIVGLILQSHYPPLLMPSIAIRRRLTSRPISLPTSRLGDPNTCDSATIRRCRCWELLERGDDTEQPQEGREGHTEEIEIELPLGSSVQLGVE
jgi:hypothetical protein